MQFRVLWTPDAENQLEQLIKSSSNPDILAAAARQIDQFLVTAPADFGESRFDTIRVAFVFPLGVQFEIMDDVRTVIVHDLWLVTRN